MFIVDDDDVFFFWGFGMKTMNRRLLVFCGSLCQDKGYNRFFSTLTLMSLTWSNSGTGLGLLKSQTT